MIRKNRSLETLFWSIAFPGFGQLLNGRYVKGILLVILELLVNVNANFNQIILLSFQGEISKAIQITNYQWLMFYPCLYFFAMWDAWNDSAEIKDKYAFLPFVFSGYSVTVGCIYSSQFEIFGILLGPVWLPILCVIPGLIVGLLIKAMINRKKYL